MKINCAMFTDPFHLKVDFQATDKNINYQYPLYID